MNKANFYNILLLLIIVFCFCLSCKNHEQQTNTEETILKGKVTIFVDETIMPIVEDQVMVFESKYDAKIELVPLSEAELIQEFFKQKSPVAIMARNLNDNELKVLGQKKIAPKSTKFATDAIALIANSKLLDTIVDLNELKDFLKGKKNAGINGLVFDNPNSSTVRMLKELAGVSDLPKEGIYSFKTNQEVLHFVAENNEMIGVVGLNWLSQPKPEMDADLKKINLLSICALKSTLPVQPTQNNIAENTYPLARDLFIVNAQGYSGLVMGFASFVAGDIGQRIVLKSGLMPQKMPGRKINIRK